MGPTYREGEGGGLEGAGGGGAAAEKALLSQGRPAGSDPSVSECTPDAITIPAQKSLRSHRSPGRDLPFELVGLRLTVRRSVYSTSRIGG